MGYGASSRCLSSRWPETLNLRQKGSRAVRHRPSGAIGHGWLGAAGYGCNLLGPVLRCLFVTQAGVADPAVLNSNIGETCLGPIRNTLEAVFSCVIPYQVHILSFGGLWGFVMAFNGDDTDKAYWKNPKKEDIDRLIEENIIGGESVLDFYDGQTHKGIMALPKMTRKALENDKRIMTIENPVFMF